MSLVTPPPTTTSPQQGNRAGQATQAHRGLRLRLRWPRTRQTPWEQFCADLSAEKQLVDRLLQ
jgi:hypothetical protein